MIITYFWNTDNIPLVYQIVKYYVCAISTISCYKLFSFEALSCGFDHIYLCVSHLFPYLSNLILLILLEYWAASLNHHNSAG
jgi:hypothetical protein